MTLGAMVVCTASASNATAAPSAPTATGGIGIRLLDAPTSAANDPRARVYIIDHLAAGAVIQRQIGVSNSTTSTAHVLLYAAGATIANGSFLGDAGETPNDLSTWMSVNPGVADIPAGGQVTATVTIAVPRNAAPGEQYAAVWAQVTSAPAPGAGTIIQISRVGIRLYLSVGSGNAPASNFTINSLTAERTAEGQPSVVATVDNTGGRAVDMSGSLQLSAGPAGLSAGPFPATLGVTLAPGQTEPVTILLDKQLPAGPWQARITLVSGLLQRSAEATLTFPPLGSGGATLAAPTTPSAHPGWRDPAIAGLALLMVTGGGAVLLRYHRRRYRGRPSYAKAPSGSRHRFKVP